MRADRPDWRLCGYYHLDLDVRHLSGAPYGAGGLRLRGGQTTAFRSAEVRDEMFCACVSLREERETHTQLAFFRPDLRR